MVSNCEPNDITDPLQISMYMQMLFNPPISTKTIRHTHPTLQTAIDYEQKFEREYLLAEGIQQTEFDIGMSIDTITGNNPIKQ